MEVNSYWIWELSYLPDPISFLALQEYFLSLWILYRGSCLINKGSYSMCVYPSLTRLETKSNLSGLLSHPSWQKKILKPQAILDNKRILKCASHHDWKAIFMSINKSSCPWTRKLLFVLGDLFIKSHYKLTCTDRGARWTETRLVGNFFLLTSPLTYSLSLYNRDSVQLEIVFLKRSDVSLSCSTNFNKK